MIHRTRLRVPAGRLVQNGATLVQEKIDGQHTRSLSNKTLANLNALADRNDRINAVAAFCRESLQSPRCCRSWSSRVRLSLFLRRFHHLPLQLHCTVCLSLVLRHKQTEDDNRNDGFCRAVANHSIVRLHPRRWPKHCCQVV